MSLSHDQEMRIGAEFVQVSVAQLRTSLERIETCVGKLTGEQIWRRHSENENAVGNLLLHLSGNVRQWIIGGVGGAPGARDRDAEFAARAGMGKTELLGLLRRTVEEAIGVIESVEPARLAARIFPQGYDVTVLGAIYHVVEHFCGHAFQIILLTKLLTGQDLGFYAHLAGNRESGHGNQA
jgi:uncharacterized protein DUF1572